MLSYSWVGITLYRLDGKTLSTVQVWHIRILPGCVARAEIKYYIVHDALPKRPINQTKGTKSLLS